MLNEVKVLLPLQEWDLRILSLKEDLEKIPVQVVSIEQKIQRVKDLVEEKKKELSNIKLAYKDKEMDLGKKEEEVRKLQSRLFQVKTNKEYSAIQEEIKNLKEEISNLEGLLLEELERIDEKEEELKKVKEEAEIEISQLLKEKKDVEERIQVLKSEYTKLMEERENYARRVPPDTYQMYQRIMEHRKGKVLCKVGKDGVCSGCYRALSPQVINELMQGQKLILCEGCGGILFYEEG